VLSLLERRARCSCDLCSRLFAQFALSLLLSAPGESLGLVPDVFGVDSLLMLPTQQQHGKEEGRIGPYQLRRVTSGGCCGSRGREARETPNGELDEAATQSSSMKARGGALLAQLSA